MDYSIPLTYELNIYDLFKDPNEIECTYNYKNKVFTFNDFSLYINKNNLIYRITSIITLDYLLDHLYIYENLIIKKIYYFLIIKHLINLDFIIKKEDFNYSCIDINDYYDIFLNTRDYHISNNDEIIITDYIKSNICLIIINKKINKSVITIIDRNSILTSLIDIILDNDINKDNNIEIIIIGSSIDNIDMIINIYRILKELNLSKFIFKTHLFKSKEIKRLKFNTINKSIKLIRNNSYYDLIDDPNNINDINFFSELRKK